MRLTFLVVCYDIAAANMQPLPKYEVDYDCFVAIGYTYVCTYFLYVRTYVQWLIGFEGFGVIE